MRRSHRTLLFALTVALIASFALPMTASAGSSSDLDCADFSSQQEAQDEFESGGTDNNRLDEDDDGEACEDSFGTTDEFSDDASTDEYPRRGVQTGGGSTATGGTSPLPLILSGGAFALLMATGGGIAVRRRLGR